MRCKWTLPGIKYICAAMNTGKSHVQLARKFGISTENVYGVAKRYLIKNAREYVLNPESTKTLPDIPMKYPSGAVIELDDLPGVDVNSIVAPGTLPSAASAIPVSKPAGKEYIVISAVLLHNYDKEAAKLTAKGQKFSSGRKLIEKLLLILNDNPTYIENIIDDDSES